MSGIAKAALAAALLNCGLLNASATDTSGGGWLKDGACALFSADAHPGDSVSWTGSCVDGYAEGLGTATLDPDRIARVRDKNPAIRLRRFSVTAKVPADLAESAT